MNDYMARVLIQLQKHYPHESEYLQAVQLWMELISPAAEDPLYEKLDLLTRMVEPERMFSFQVPWVDDQGRYTPITATGCSSTAPSAPIKGVCASTPQWIPLWSSSWGLSRPIKMPSPVCPSAERPAGPDFDPGERASGRSCGSVTTLCGPCTGISVRTPTCPPEDIGVGTREIGYLYGEYKRLTGRAESSALTGKGLTYGGSKVRQGGRRLRPRLLPGPHGGAGRGDSGGQADPGVWVRQYGLQRMPEVGRAGR